MCGFQSFDVLVFAKQKQLAPLTLQKQDLKEALSLTAITQSSLNTEPFISVNAKLAYLKTEIKGKGSIA